MDQFESSVSMKHKDWQAKQEIEFEKFMNHINVIKQSLGKWHEIHLDQDRKLKEINFKVTDIKKEVYQEQEKQSFEMLKAIDY